MKELNLYDKYLKSVLNPMHKLQSLVYVISSDSGEWRLELP